MKIFFNPSISNLKTRTLKTITKPETPVDTEKQGSELPSFAQIGQNLAQINFRGFKNPLNEKYLKEIANLKLERDSLISKTADSVVQDAKNKLRRLANWNDASERQWAEKCAKEAGEAAKQKHIAGHNGVWQFFHGNGTKQYCDAYDAKMDSCYWNPHFEIEDIKYKKKTYDDIVRLANESEELKQARLKEIDILIERTQKLINYQGLQDEVNQMLSARGGIEDRIAGYEDEKNEINAKFVQLLAKSKDDASTKVPACVLLYGPTGTGKTTFLHGIMEQSRDYAHIVDMSSFKTAGSFKQLLNNELENANNRYIDEKKRTIILLNDAEDIFTISEKEAEILGVKLDGQDETIMESSHDSFKNVSNFKQLLDTVSEIPDSNQKGGRHATTFFITTNYPHLIHPDLLSREGKMTKIAIGLAKDNNLVEVLKFYFKNMESVAERLRALKDNPDYESYLNGLAGITDKGRENLKKIIETGEIEHLHVDYNHMPYEQLAKAMNPSTKIGAYSNDRIRVICQEAFLDYLEKNPAEDDYKTSFYRSYRNTKRDINPERLKKFNLIDRMIKDEKIEIETLEELLEQRNLGLLSEKQANLLEYHINKINIELESLNERETHIGLTQEEQETKKALLAKKETIDNYSIGDSTADDFE